MRKTIIYSVVIAVFLTVVVVPGVFAQELESVQKQETYDLLIEVEEALDQIEKHFDPAVAEEGLSVDPAISGSSEVKIDKDLSTGTEQAEDAFDIRNLELDTDEVVGAGDLEGNDDAEEAESQTDVSTDSTVEDAIVTEVVELPEIGSAADEEEDAVLGEAPSPEPEEEFEVKVIPLLHAEASSLIETLNEMKSPSGEISYDEEDRTLILKDAPPQLEAMSAFVKEVDILLETEGFPLEHVRAGDIIENIKAVLTENVGQVQFDEEANNIIATDTPLKIGRIKELIRSLDRIDIEISIGTRILQVVLNDEHPDGVDWEAIVSEYQRLTLSEQSGEDAPAVSLGTISQEDYDILLEALDTVGVVSTVIEEDIRAQNETKKTISTPVLPEQGEGIQFQVTPIVKEDKTLEVIVKNSEKTQREVTVQMKSGETIVIGGVFKDVMVASTWKVPLLGDLPLLGFVFRSEGQRSRQAEIITFLTVKAVEKKKL